MPNSEINVVILAAGKGSRMYSNIPKVLHTLAGKPMIQHIINTAKKLSIGRVYLVYGHGGDLLKKTLKEDSLNWIFQAEQLGTGDAIKQVIPFLNDYEDVLVLYGDVPFVSVKTLTNLCNAKPHGGICLLTTRHENPCGYGRITRKNGKITGVVEHDDATDEERKIQEISTGILIAGSADMKRWLSNLSNNNSHGEYYITDIVSLAYQEGRIINAVHPEHVSEVEGINNFLQLSRLERIYQVKQAKKLLLAGVMIRDPCRFDLRGNLTYGHDIEIDIDVILKGNVVLGNYVKIGSGCIIKNSIIGDNCKINSYSMIENSYLQANCTIGPFAHLRPGTKLLERVHVGNFVEIKKTSLGNNSKVGHLSYLGDAEIGSNVNIGAGTITCNYDGANKFKTHIGNDVFVGSDTQLIAPVHIGHGATIAAGTTITHNVSDNELVLSKVVQVHKQGWQRPVKK